MNKIKYYAATQRRKIKDTIFLTTSSLSRFHAFWNNMIDFRKHSRYLFILFKRKKWIRNVELSIKHLFSVVIRESGDADVGRLLLSGNPHKLHAWILLWVCKKPTFLVCCFGRWGESLETVSQQEQRDNRFGRRGQQSKLSQGKRETLIRCRKSITLHLCLFDLKMFSRFKVGIWSTK